MIRPLLLLLVCGLAACGPLVQVGGNAPPPAALLVLRSDAPPPQWQGPAALSDTLGVAVPDVPAELQTLRLPVQIDGASVQYLAGAAWSEQPGRQFQRLLSDRLAAAGVPVLDTRSGSASPARTLTGHLREFGLDVRSAAVVRVRYDAQLAGPRSTGTVALKSFVAQEPVSSQQPAAVAAALSRASNRLAAEVAAWVKP
ncbi:ABC-type transport auxiliary lipoprotein family protein [Sandarakinorhabdus sp.]|uniref:ABC-type transport auxiliary lipoprotein family protein n=1 Tax=Sandarakinorhabdus sp. TaxID=1916663 RepID=UPI00333FDA8D